MSGFGAPSVAARLFIFMAITHIEGLRWITLYHGISRRPKLDGGLKSIAVAVPEPACALSLAIGSLGLLLRHRPSGKGRVSLLRRLGDGATGGRENGG